LRHTGRATQVEGTPRSPLWTATERWPLIRAVWPAATARPQVSVPPGVRQDWSREEAIVFVIRGRLESAGPTTVGALARALGLDASDVESALAALEVQGVVLRGRFTGAEELEWCDRRLLARIHRLTLEGLRRQIAAVPPEQFVRFLVRHQHVHRHARLRGQEGLLALVEQLEGFEAPAGHWEKYLLPSRLESYSPGWLDGLTFFGQAAWGRLVVTTQPGKDTNGGNGRPLKALTRSTPITLMLREDVGWLLPPLEEHTNAAAILPLGSNARAAYEAFLSHGALFPGQLGSFLQLVPAQVDDVLGELAAAGLVTSDGYPALRALLGGKLRKTRPVAWRPRPGRDHPTGRWTLLRSALTPAAPAEQRAERWCWLLLRRYGVMFRDLLASESPALSWGELVRTYRRLEARGEIRGGRFVAGVAGEQYALPEAISLLRSAAADPDEKPLILPATDPLNVSGRITPGPRVPALPGQLIALAKGQVNAHQPALCRGLPSPSAEVAAQAGSTE
jgi:ATP-dependent Lhr-like helicase